MAMRYVPKTVGKRKTKGNSKTLFLWEETEKPYGFQKEDKEGDGRSWSKYAGFEEMCQRAKQHPWNPNHVLYNLQLAVGSCCYVKLCKPRNQHDIGANQNFYSYWQIFTKNIILTYQELRHPLAKSILNETNSNVRRPQLTLPANCILELLFSFFPALLHLRAHILFSVHKLFSVQFPHLPQRLWSVEETELQEEGKWWDLSSSHSGCSAAAMKLQATHFFQ